MSDSKSKSVTVRVPEEVHRPARIKAAQLGVSLQEVLLQALQDWSGGSSEVHFTPNKRYAALLDHLGKVLEYPGKERSDAMIRDLVLSWWKHVPKTEQET